MTWLQHYHDISQTLEQLFFLMSALIHVLFAGAVAKDCGRLQHLGLSPILVSSSTWAFTTLLGGVWVAGLYWFLHHSTLTRNLHLTHNQGSRNETHQSKPPRF